MKTGKTIRVVHIASGDLWAGAEVQLFTLAKTLQGMTEVSIHVILMNHGRLADELKKQGIEVTVLDEARLNGLQIFVLLIKKLRAVQPDVIHTHRQKENIIGSVAALACGNIPTLRTAHGAPEHKITWHNIPKRLFLFLDEFCGRYLQQKIIAVSADLATTLQKNYPASKISVIENGIDLASFSGTKHSQNKPQSPAREPFRITAAGRLVPVKRFDIFLRTAAILHDSHPELNMHFHIFGDGPLRGDLEALSAQLNINDIVHFEGHCENMQQRLSEMDMLLMPSDHEGLPMILLEAMALRTAIVTHATGGIPHLLDNGECGLLVTDHQPNTYARSIYQLIVDRKQRLQLTENAYRRVSLHYSSNQNALVYFSHYKNLS